MNQAETTLKALGNWNSIAALEACITRIRVEVKDDETVDEKSLHDAGALGVVAVDRFIQVVMGPETEAVADAIEALR